MKTGAIFVLLVVIAVPPLAYSKSEALWGQRVFPDDREWLSPIGRKHLEDGNSKKQVDTKPGTVCETQECKIIAKEFLSSINKQIDPCDDFYEFSCGGWSAKDVVPPSSPTWSRFMIFDNTAKHRIKGILEAPIESSDILPVRQAKKWYRSCMDTDNLDRRGITPLESVLMQVGGWPITMDEEEWDSAEYTWQKVASYYADLTGRYAFYEITVIPPQDDDEFGTLMIMPARKTLDDQIPESYRNYTGDDYDAYVRLVESAAELFVEHNKANVPKEKLRKEAEEIVEFEKELFEIEAKSRNYDETDFRSLTDWYDNITNTDSKAEFDLTSGIQHLFDVVNIKIDPDTDIAVRGTSFFKGLPELLKKTPARTIVNYIHWTFVGNMMIYTSERVRNELLAFVWQQFGVKERPPRWYECVRAMNMDHAAAYEFVEKYFPKTTKNAALEMIKNIQTAMGEKIKSSNWLDAESKVIAKDKLDSMNVFVGFPNWYKNKTAIVNFYKGLTIGADYFDNVMSYTRYKNKGQLRLYLKHSTPSSADETWYMDPITVNALYSPDGNFLNLPAVDFQAPLFTRNLPDTVNYGIAGVIVGHEMGHGFDTAGIQYGKYGNDTELSAKILKSYYQRAECFTDQFEEYYRELSGSGSEGTTSKSQLSPADMSMITSGENIADTTGIQAVFQAYQKLDKGRGPSKLPGFEEYTEDQHFFLSFGAMWCEVETSQYKEKRKAMGDSHSPAKLRVIGAVSNTKDFARVFNCPKDSAMNPSNKCNIWEKSETASKEKQPSTRRQILPWATQWKT